MTCDTATLTSAEREAARRSSCGPEARAAIGEEFSFNSYFAFRQYSIMFNHWFIAQLDLISVYVVKCCLADVSVCSQKWLIAEERSER